MSSIVNLIQNEYSQSFLILLGSILLAQVINFIIKNYVKRITQRTKSPIDDIVLETIAKPLYVLVITIGLFLSLKSLSVMANFKSWIDRLFFVIWVLIVSVTASRLLAVLVPMWLKVQKKFEKTPRLISRIIAAVIYAIAFLIILDHFGIKITPLIATLGLGGLAVGLALQSTLSNFFAGLHIIADRPINVGDFIELPGANISGYVEDIGWRSIRIKTLLNTIVIIPNSKLADSVIINHSLPEPEIAALVECGVSYSSDLKKVEKVTIDVAREIQRTVNGAVKTFEPFIRYHSFGDSNINFTVVLRVQNFEYRRSVIHEFIKALKERYDKEGIEISFPIRKIYYGNNK